MNTRVKAKDIAKLVGCSVSTVSKALRDNHEISEATKRKINHIARLYDYRPDKNALSLKFGKKFSIGIIIPSFEDPFFSRIMHGVEDQIVDTEYTLTTAVTRESAEREKSVLRKMLDNVDGIIMGISKETKEKGDLSHIEGIIRSKKPLVLIDWENDELECNRVNPDSRKAVEQILVALDEKDCKNNLIITSSPKSSLSRTVNRYFAIKDGVNGYPGDTLVLVSDETEIASDIENRIKIGMLDTIIALDQIATLAAVQVVNKLELKVPDDIRVIGCVPKKIAEMLTPSITTIDLHRKTIGKHAIDLILEELRTSDGAIPKPRDIHIDASLVRRVSF